MIRRIDTILLCYVVLAVISPAQTFKTLYTFTGGADGESPGVPLVQGLDGSFYGTTEYAGDYIYGGSVFGITREGVETTLFSFDYTDGRGMFDSGLDFGGLVQAVDGYLYGATPGGGANTGCDFGSGCGTIYKIDPAGTLTTLYNFDGTEGNGPGWLMQALDGYIYGAAGGGGPSNACFGGCGTLFKFSTSGVLTTLHYFMGTDGGQPVGVIQASDGNFYGTTVAGGANGDGTVFRMTPEGGITTLHSFDGSDGSSPFGGVIQALDGNFYGTTMSGGANNDGSVFKITPGGALTTLHSFDGSDGGWVYGGLVQATDGNFYGTTGNGGAAGLGTIYQIDSQGVFTTIYNMGANGYLPMVGLLQATDGSFYGTTRGAIAGEGGTGTSNGTIFVLSMGLDRFVKTLPHASTVGSTVKILGTNLTGATNVTFNGIAATFSVLRPSLMAATVPAGATTGSVQVTTSGATLLSNIPFRVLQWI
ncbi:MAG: choice-of-anchor tandem repeat GloVer-containing protein [Bryobacteraceae bacterium]|jgi:uncharacterized repeat protein (TIGR03803 family)